VFATTGPRGLEESSPATHARTLEGTFTAFPDLAVTFTRVVARDRFAVVEWIFQGTHLGELAGKPATRRKVSYRGASVLTFAPDGGVQRETAYFDRSTLFGQLGLVKGERVRGVEARPTAPTRVLFGTENDRDELARAWLQALEAGDTKSIELLASDDLVVAAQAMPADLKGKKALERDVAETMKSFTDAKITVVFCLPTSTVIACEYERKATWTGTSRGKKPTGRTGYVHTLEVLSVEGGKILTSNVYADGVEHDGAFGLLDDAGSKR
jgi:steroid delta-isomerase-like uncharacterized protein